MRGLGEKGAPEESTSEDAVEIRSELPTIDETAGSALPAIDETAGAITSVIDGQPARKSEAPPRYKFVSQPPPPPAVPGNVIPLRPGVHPEIRRKTTDPRFREEEPTSTSMRSLSVTFNGLHPKVQSCVARLMPLVESPREFYELYRVLLDTPFVPLKDKKMEGSNILFLQGLSTLLDGKIIALPVLANGDPCQHKSSTLKSAYEWKIIDCTEGSLDVDRPRVWVLPKNVGEISPAAVAIPLDVILYYNKPY